MANLVARVEEDRPTAGIAAERAAATERAAPVPERVVEEVPLLPWSRGLGAEAEVVVRLVDPFGLVAERHRHQQCRPSSNPGRSERRPRRHRGWLENGRPAMVRLTICLSCRDINTIGNRLRFILEFYYFYSLGMTLLGGNNAYGTLLPPALGHLSPCLVGRRCSGWSSHSRAAAGSGRPSATKCAERRKIRS